MPLTTDSFSGSKRLRCDLCRKETDVLVDRPSRRRVCVDCLPEREKAVYRKEK